MKIIVGLGNQGKRYRHTPHNIGFAVIDELASELSCVLRRSFRFGAFMGNVLFNEEKILLVKPQTYMNKSGFVVASILRYRKLTPADMVVIVDDADLDMGCLRIRARGSGGGHKGLESVIQCAGSEDFLRIRLGIGRDSDAEGLVEHVLRPFSPEEEKKAEHLIKHASQAVLCILESGVEVAMNRFNRRANSSGG